MTNHSCTDGVDDQRTEAVCASAGDDVRDQRGVATRKATAASSSVHPYSYSLSDLSARIERALDPEHCNYGPSYHLNATEAEVRLLVNLTRGEWNAIISALRGPNCSRCAELERDLGLERESHETTKRMLDESSSATVESK